MCCTSVLNFQFKNLQIISKLLIQGYRYHKLRKTFGKFFRSHSELLSKFGNISCQEYVSKGISHPVFYGYLTNYLRLRRIKNTPNFISSGSKMVKHLRRRRYDPLIIEMTIGVVLDPSSALYKPFLKHCTLTNITRRRGLYDGPCSNLLRGDKVLIFVPSDCYSGLLQPLDLSSLPDGRSIACPIRMWPCHCIYFWYKIFVTYAVRVSIFMTSPLEVAVGLLSIKGGLFTNF